MSELTEDKQMKRLTHPRLSGIKTGYWSEAKKDALIQRLGPIEENLPHLLDRVCDCYCNKSHEGLCDECPMATIYNVLEGDLNYD